MLPIVGLSKQMIRRLAQGLVLLTLSGAVVGEKVGELVERAFDEMAVGLEGEAAIALWGGKNEQTVIDIVYDF